MTTAPASHSFNNGAQPLIMAYTAGSVPERGDNRAAVGVARAVAGLMGGDFLHVDYNTLKRNYDPLTKNDGGVLSPNYPEALKALVKRYGTPDIAIGPRTYHFDDISLPGRPPLFIKKINEYFYELLPKEKRIRGLVSHNLDSRLLAFERAKFRAHYPGIEGPLVAVMMGGELLYPQQLARTLTALGSAYPKATFFLCPSRRTHEFKDLLLGCIKSAIRETDDWSGNPPPDSWLGKMFNNLARHDPPRKLGDVITLLDVDYEKALDGYNPYLGLLASADHIIVAGESYSLVSEAIFTGKNVYLHEAVNDYQGLTDRGYVQNIDMLDDFSPLPTHALPPLDLRHDLAEAIVQTYWNIYMPPGRPRLPPPLRTPAPHGLGQASHSPSRKRGRA